MELTFWDKIDGKLRLARVYLMAEKCLYCKEIMGYGGFVLCPRCKEKLIDTSDTDRMTEVGRLLVSYEYTEELRPLIHSLKYRRNREAGMFLAQAIANTCKRRGEGEPDLVLGVPCYRRAGQRKFCQAEYVAEQVALRLKRDFSDLVLYKHHNAKSQTFCHTSQERRDNVKDVYKVRPTANLKGKSILLVDDVTTTGATLNECAKVLKEAGAAKIVCVAGAKPLNPEKKELPIRLGSGYYEFSEEIKG